MRRSPERSGVQGVSCTENALRESDKLLVSRQDDEPDYDYDHD
jgi:hypothetical protein